MKKIYKIMVFILMLALAVGSAVIAPVTVFASASALIGATIILKNMPKTGTIGTPVELPKGSVTNGSSADAKVTVIGPNGKEVSVQDGKFTPTLIGDYKVVYTAEANGSHSKTTSNVYTIKVSGAKATFDFKENTPYILQSKAGLDTTVVLPNPTIKVNDEEVADASATIKVTDPNHNTWTLGETKEGFTSPIKQVTIDGESHIAFSATKQGEGAVYGDYTITYEYKSSKTIPATETKHIQVAKNYSVKDQDVTFTWDGSMPESAVLGNEVTLPKPVTVDANFNNESVATYTKVEVSFVDKQGQENAYDVKDFKFTPMDMAKSGTYYKITYKIYTLEQLDLAKYSTLQEAISKADEAGKVLVKTYTLKNVTDTVAPVLQAVNAYSVKEDGTLEDNVVESLKDQDVSYSIPSKAKTQVEVEIPAIYATDNYSKYNGITLTRTLIDEDGNTYSLDGDAELNKEASDNAPKVVQAKVNQTAKVTFKFKGTYTVRYRAKDEANNSKDVSYKIVVTDSLVDNVAPTITKPTIVSTAKPGEKVTFGAPTVVDYATDATSPVTIDTNVKKDVYLYYGQITGSTNFDTLLENGSLTPVSKDKDDSSKYSFVIDSATESKYVNVIFRAEDDAKYADGNSKNNVAWTSETVVIYNVKDDVAPTLVGTLDSIKDSIDDNTYGQTDSDPITIPGEIKFTDSDNDGDATKFLTASLRVYDKNGTEIKVRGVKYSYDGTNYIISGGKFYPTIAGEYQIVITATDLGGNSLINSITFNVNDTKKPSVYPNGDIQTTMEIGKTYKLAKPTVVDDGVVIDNSTEAYIEFGDDNPKYNWNAGTMEFTPLEEGTYTFRYVGSDAASNVAYSDFFTITASDTEDPVISINGTVDDTVGYKDEENNVLSVKLPLFTATDELNGIKTTELKVTDPDGDELEVTELEDHYEFTPNRNGKFTVTYTATDLAGNTATQTYTIKVGDVTAPTVSGTSIPGDYKVGDTLSIDLSNIKLADEVDGETDGKDAVKTSSSAKSKLDIVLTDPSGSSVSFDTTDDIWTYKFEKAGRYTLTYKATDSAGNTDDNLRYTFEVKSNKNSTSISEKTWGIILSVVAVALLAGVVVYFIKTKDTSTNVKSNKTNGQDNK